MYCMLEYVNAVCGVCIFKICCLPLISAMLKIMKQVPVIKVVKQDNYMNDSSSIPK